MLHTGKRYGMNITIEPLNVDNWLEICGLSVSEEQKLLFTVPNVYWIGISRYEEHTDLYAIKSGEDYVGLIGCGLDEDGISGYINPLMIDEGYQHQGIGEKAMHLIMDHLIRRYHVPCIHINHRKENYAAARLYERLGFYVYTETDTEYCRNYAVDYGVLILTLCDHPERADECRALLYEHFNELVSKDPAEVLKSIELLPHGYFMLKDNRVIGWAGLCEKEAVSGKVYGWKGSFTKEEVFSEDLSPWLTPLLIHPDERGNHYGKLLLEHVRTEAGKLGFKTLYVTTGEIGYYEKYGFREVGLTTFAWGRPTKVYKAEVI